MDTGGKTALAFCPQHNDCLTTYFELTNDAEIVLKRSEIQVDQTCSFIVIMESAAKKESKRKRGRKGKRSLDDDEDDDDDEFNDSDEFGEPDGEADEDELYYGKNHFYEVLILEGKSADFDI